MKKLILVFAIFFLNNLHSQNIKQYIDSIISVRNLKNKEFLNPDHSPFDEKEIQNFKELNYFAVDTGYRVYARFHVLKKKKTFQMQTTTQRLPEYKKYAYVDFYLNNNPFRLYVYQNIELSKKEEYKNYLFIPFTDLTNGIETYGGGRYLDLKIPDGDIVVLDFNLAYNPYCCYNYKYSCPIPPAENFLNISIESGEKIYYADK